MSHIFSVFHLPYKIMKAFLGLLVLTGSLSAQVNTERMRKWEAERGWSNELGVSLSSYGGNSRLFLLNGSYRMDWVGLRTYSFVVGNYVRGTSGGDVILHKGFAHLRLQRSLAAHWKAEAFAQAEFNDFILLRDRRLAGAGFRYELFGADTNTVKPRPLHVNVGSGWMAEQEAFSEGAKDDTRWVRSTNYLSVRWNVDSKTFLHAVGYFQAPLTARSKYRVLLESSAGVGINKILTVVATWNYRYDRDPAAGIKRYDYVLSNGVTVSF